MSPLLETFANASRRGYAPGGATVIPNSYELISTITLTGTGTFSFTSIPQTYQHFQLRWSLRDSNASVTGNFRMRFNGNSSTIYRWNFFVESAQGGTAAQFGTYANNTFAGNNANGNWFGTGVIDIENATSSSLRKSINGLWGSIQNTSISGWPGYCAGTWNNTAAINQIDIFTPGSGWAEKSRVSLYGIKGVA